MATVSESNSTFSAANIYHEVVEKPIFARALNYVESGIISHEMYDVSALTVLKNIAYKVSMLFIAFFGSVEWGVRAAFSIGGYGLSSLFRPVEWSYNKIKVLMHKDDILSSSEAVSIQPSATSNSDKIYQFSKELLDNNRKVTEAIWHASYFFLHKTNCQTREMRL